jgi:ERCC4-type nuclease
MDKIIVDSREPVDIKVQFLESGDVRMVVDNKIVKIERKTWYDLKNSLYDGRLAIQCNQLKADCWLSMMIITGYPPKDDLFKHNLLFSIKLTGVLVETLFDASKFKDRVIEIYEYLKANQHISMIPYRYNNPKLGALMWVGGIGYSHAKKLLELYQGDLVSIYVSEKRALSKVLGDALADRFYTAIRKPVKVATKEDYDLWA